MRLVSTKDFACVSIYMPTHCTPPAVKQDLIRYKNLLKQMEERLVQCGFRKSKARTFAARAKALTRDVLFWQYQSIGFAAFLSSYEFCFYRLPVPFEELLVITDRFHIKPLLRFFAYDGRFYILTLSQNAVKLFQCSRYSIAEVELQNTPGNLAEALRLDQPKKQLQFHTKTPGGLGARSAIFHGHGAGKDESKSNILKFFQQVDQGLQKILKVDRDPLVLAGVDYLFPIYQEASSYPQLMEQGIPGNPESLKPEELQKEAWVIVEPYYLKTREAATARYKQLAGSESASDDVKTIALAAYQGRVELLFTAVGIQKWGSFDPAIPSVHLHEDRVPRDEDLLDFAAIHTILRGGTVYALKPEEMPDRTQLAAIFRY